MNRIAFWFIIMSFAILVGVFPLFSQPASLGVDIERLTHSGNGEVTHCSISADGRYVIYVLETKSGSEVQKTIRMLHVDSGKTEDIFTEGQTVVEKPFGKGSLMVGSKPPLLSGNGQVAVFTLTLGAPDNILDHYLAVAGPGKQGVALYRFSHQGISEEDMGPEGFKSPAWERISHYAVSHDGNRIACVLKGHLGPRRFGDCSGIALLDLDASGQRFLMEPVFKEDSWNWSSFPRNPLLGGGWSFSMSGNGEKLVFGAQSSQEETDYDLYVADWQDSSPRKITAFNDRWFSMAAMDFKGNGVLFYYNGKKKQGIGTYRVNADGTGLRYVESPSGGRIELYGVSVDGTTIFYKNVYRGLLMHLPSGREYVLFDGQLSGTPRGLSFMDFPLCPAFWTPETINMTGDRLLIFGSPQGRQSAEIYMLSFDQSNIRQ